MNAKPDANEKNRMIVRTVDKRNTQKMIKALRDAGLEVVKEGMKYECKDPRTDSLLFAALNGRHGYLIRMRADLFV